MHVMRILHFPSSSQEDSNSVDCSLEESLAQVLPQFYPLAGRYNRDHHHVDCNDQGADFSEARIDCRLSQLIGADSDLLNRLLPLDICTADDPTDPMLAIRINRFECGGLAIGVCASHRIFDSASLGIFLTAWANASIGGSPIIRPDFDIATYFPSEKLPPLQFQVSRTRDSSRSKFGDYDLDFGFGKPVWVSLCDVPLKDMFILMNIKDNEGIEAWVYLHESDMSFFEKNEYIRHLTTPLSKM